MPTPYETYATPAGQEADQSGMAGQVEEGVAEGQGVVDMEMDVD